MLCAITRTKIQTTLNKTKILNENEISRLSGVTPREQSDAFQCLRFRYFFFNE